MSRYDTAVLNGIVVIPYYGPVRCDIGVRDGVIVTLSDAIAPTEAGEVIDAKGKLVLPGAVDSHFHLGIYRPLAEDVESETASSLVGGVTTVLSYFRTGHSYLNRSGPYREIFPEVLTTTAGRAHTDFGYHIAIMTPEQLDEVDWLVAEQGVATFKYYMFYKGLTLKADSTQASDYTMAGAYDLGHLYQIMQRVAAASARYGQQGRISLSLHCEQSEIIRVFIEEVKRSGLTGLEAYTKARPTLSERLAVREAGVLADATGCPINLLHLSSAEALAAGVQARREYPHLDIRLEATLHHLALTYSAVNSIEGKVNPPIRGPEDNEALWQGIKDGYVETVVSDHASCLRADKGNELWNAQPGFGGTSLIYPILLSEGYHRRGLPLQRVVEVAAANPARNYGLYPKKGAIAVGADADLAIVDPNLELTVTTEMLLSAQDFTPFAGARVKGWPTHTLLRGQLVYADGRVVASPSGRYLRRPIGLHAADRSPAGTSI
ncbi:MAG: dihydropyrimidinase [Chloroflexota bacterium]|nr:MAG: dihydropyrimidinase [Chloroflexota bacterium]